MKIEWTESMATGVASVDAQHKQLIDMLNALMEAMGQGRGKHEIAQILARLGDYTQKHFAHEEECMARYQCPAAAVNKQAHAQFLKTFLSLRDRHSAHGADAMLVLDVQRELSEWLVKHVKGVDVKLAPCVKTAAPAR
jgi:hemerythrin